MRSRACVLHSLVVRSVACGRNTPHALLTPAARRLVSGILTAGEMRRAIDSTAIGVYPANPGLRAGILEHIQDGKAINFPEFCHLFAGEMGDVEVETLRAWLLTKQSKKAEAMLLDLFCQYDTNNDGVLQASELMVGLQGSGLSMDYMLMADKVRGSHAPSRWVWRNPLKA